MRLAKQILLQTTGYGALLLVPVGVAPVAAQLPTVTMTETSRAALRAEQQQAVTVTELPDSPGTTVSKRQLPAEAASSPSDKPASMQLLAMQARSEPQDTELAQPQVQTKPAPQSPTQRPVGTAAAGPIPGDGIAASRPAGVAIAPAKQRRVRTIVLRMGAIVGAGVAVGSVVALTQATPSKPPGAH